MAQSIKMDEQALRQRVRRILLERAAAAGQGQSPATSQSVGTLGGSAISAGSAYSGGARKRKARKTRKGGSAISGGAWYDFLDPSKNGVGDAFNKVKNEFTNPDSILRSQVLPVAQQAAEVGAMVAGLGAPRKQSAKQKARQKLVSQLVKKGMTLPQASHYIKVNNLL